MFEDERIVQAVNAPTSDFREVRGRSSVVAFFLGIAIIAACIFLGHRYVLFPILALSFLVTLVWRKAPRPWIFLVSILAASPVALSRQKIEPNLIFALWFVVFNIRYLFKLPKWIYVTAALAVLGIFTGAINWISGDVVRNLVQQGAYAYTYVIGTFILLPVVYSRMGESQDHAANLQGLLFCLIIPSTLILCLTKWFGTPFNVWEASLRGDQSAGYIMYRLGKAYVNFMRTEVGFIFAALTCASTAIVVSQVKRLYRLLGGVCLALNTTLLLVTGSLGSIIACLCGLAAVFYGQFRTVKITRVLASATVIACMLLLIWGLSPGSVKEYLGKHYQARASAGTDQDRFMLWGRAVEQILDHPEGVGWTVSVGDRVRSVIHNEYLGYAVSYGVTGGLAYASLVAGLMIYFLQCRKRRTEDHSALAINLAGLGVVAALAVNSMTDHVASSRWYFNAIWSVIWYSYFCSRAPQTGTVPKGI
jgi:hypothetical protein